MKRIFPNQAEAVANALYEILEEQKRASRVLEQTVEAHPKWGARDRKLLYEAVYSILRWKRKFDAMAEVEEKRIPSMAVDQKLVHAKRLRHSRLEGDAVLTSCNQRRIDSFSHK